MVDMQAVCPRSLYQTIYHSVCPGTGYRIDVGGKVNGFSVGKTRL